MPSGMAVSPSPKLWIRSASSAAPCYKYRLRDRSSSKAGYRRSCRRGTQHGSKASSDVGVVVVVLVSCSVVRFVVVVLVPRPVAL